MLVLTIGVVLVLLYIAWEDFRQFYVSAWSLILFGSLAVIRLALSSLFGGWAYGWQDGFFPFLLANVPFIIVLVFTVGLYYFSHGNFGEADALILGFSILVLKRVLPFFYCLFLSTFLAISGYSITLLLNKRVASDRKIPFAGWFSLALVVYLWFERFGGFQADDVWF